MERTLAELVDDEASQLLEREAQEVELWGRGSGGHLLGV